MSHSPQTLPGIETTEALNVQPFNVATSPTINSLLAANAPVALGVSGGKDSSAMSLAVTTYLDEIGHNGPRILIHSDLGRVEWRESLPWCQKLADNLIQRFPGQEILSPTGIRREESTTRACAPISAPQPRLSNKTHNTSGQDWHPIADWTLSEVLAYHRLRAFPLHPGYARGMTRISCAFCVMGSAGDLAVSADCPENQDVYREQVDLEILSSFAFQSGKWLGDVAPYLLSEQQQRGLAEAKRRAALREAAEKRVPKHLKYSKGWPTVMPTLAEARLLAEIRCTVADILEFSINYRGAESILERYAQLMALQQAKKGSQQITTPILSATPYSLNLWQEREVVA